MVLERRSKWWQNRSSNRPVPADPFSKFEKSDLRRVAAQLLVLAERHSRRADAMRRSAAMFQLIEDADCFEANGSMGGPKAVHGRLPALGTAAMKAKHTP